MENAVLVLNANFEPINVCNLHRAVGLMLSEKASLVMNGRGVIHSANATFPIPSVIRLELMVHAPRPTVHFCKKEIFRRDNYTCQYCGKQTTNLTIDHVLPRHLGGQHVWTNVVAACPACNHLKGGRLLSESGMKLLHIPQAPSASAMYRFARQLPENEEWREFLQGW
ncbi:MAG: HNH endonuclease [Anaerolineaceae bacterium]|jgi:5-methylcytosine-specific restriction endonuclease McrA|nr:HNH endonuclease [Anaerolineaceae bacterium]